MKKIAVILCLFCLNLLYFSDTLGGQVLLAERDLTTFFYPFRFLWVETIHQGHFPFWNPYIKCGVPLFATLQPAVLYPSSLAFLLLPFDLAFNWTIILHFFLAAAFTYLLMRELGASVQGSLAASLAFLFSGYLISVHNVLNTLLSVSWYPLAIFCGCRMVKRGNLRWAVAGGVSLCCMFLGGGIEIVIFTLASLILLCLYPNLLPLRAPENSPGLRRRVGLLGLSLAVFLGLSMVQLLPFLELYHHSDRLGGVSAQEAMRWSLAPRDLAYFLIPDVYGARTGQDQYWRFQNYLKSIYAGPVTFILAGIYFVHQGRRGLALLVALLAALALSLGKYTPIYPILYHHVPVFASMRYPVKFLFLFVFYLCVAAGLGLDECRRRFSEKDETPHWHLYLIMTAVLVQAVLLVVCRFYPGWVLNLALQRWGEFLDVAFLPKVLHNTNRVLVVGILALMVIFFALHRKLFRLGSPVLLLVLVLDLFLGNRGFAIKLDAATFHAKTDIIDTLSADTDLFRFYVSPEIKDVKVTVSGSYEDHHRLRKEFLAVDLMIEHHLFDVRGYNVPLQPRYEKLFSLVRGKSVDRIRRLLDLLNVKYVLAEGPIALPGFVPVQDGPGTSRLYENRNYLPRAFLVHDFQVLGSEEEFSRAFNDPHFDPRRTVLLERVPARLSELRQEPAVPGHEARVRVLTYENNRLVLAVDTPQSALLFMSETYYPGWKAYVDGKEEQILRANYAFRAVPVGPGSHTVELVCRPLSFRIGLSVTLATAFILLGWGWRARQRRLQ
ncbi:MAG: YfhO family protein [Syntrophobacteria bacterium]